MATEIGRLVAIIDGDFAGLQKAIAGAQKTLQNAGRSMSQAGQFLTTGLTLPIIGIGAVAAKASIDFESAFAGVRKTVDATAEELDVLRSGIRAMAKEMPASAVEISRVAEAAGQLGIRTENILEFSRVMVMLGETTNLSADEAATAMARFANIMQTPQDQFERLGATLVDLGNKGASTEAEIVQMALRIAGAGKQVGLTEAEVLAFANALSSVGVEAEAGGSAISRAFITIANAVADGGESLDKFAEVAAMSSEDFAQAFRDDPAKAMIAFMTGLDRVAASGENVFAVLDDLKLGEIRVRDALLRAAGAGDLFAQSLRDGESAWENGNALAVEYGKRVETTAAKLDILKNRFMDAAITLGDALIPALMDALEASQPLLDVITKLAEGFANLPRPVQTAIVVVAGLVAILGPLLIIIGTIASGIGALVGVLGFLGIGFAGGTLAISGFAAAFGGLIIAVAPWLVLAAAIVAGLYLLIKNWDDVSAAVTRAASAIKDAAISAFNTVLDFLKKNWPEVATLVSGPFMPIVALATDAFGIRSALTDAFQDVIKLVKRLPDEIEDALGDLGNMLFDAGREIMLGLLDGIKDGAGQVFDWVSDLGGKIAALKGPIEDDRKLLIPEGKAIMEGLATGMRIGTARVVETVDDTGDKIKALVNDQSMVIGGIYKDTGKAFGFNISSELQKYIETFRKSGMGALPKLPETDPINKEATNWLLLLDPSAYGDPDKVNGFQRTIRALNNELTKTGDAAQKASASTSAATKSTDALARSWQAVMQRLKNVGAEVVGFHGQAISQKTIDNATKLAEQFEAEAKSADKVATEVSKIEPIDAAAVESIETYGQSLEDATVAAEEFGPPVPPVKFNNVLEDTRDLLAPLPGMFAAAGQAALDFGGDALALRERIATSLREAIANAAMGAGGAAGGAATAVGGFFAGLASTIANALASAASAAASGIANVINTIATNFTAENLGRVTAWFLLWPVYLFRQAFDAVFPYLQTFFLDTLPQFILQTVPNAQIAVAEFGLNLGIGIVDALQQALTTFFLSTFPNFLASAATTIYTKGRELGTAIVNGIVDAGKESGEAVGSFFNKTIPKFIDDSVEPIYTKGKEVGGEMIKQLAQGAQDAFEFVTKLPDMIANEMIRAFVFVYKRFKEIGKSVVEGVWAGIVGARNWFFEQVKNFFKGLVEEAKAIIIPGSPSKVFTELGESIVEGLIKGIDNFSRVHIGPPLQNMMNEAGGILGQNLSFAPGLTTLPTMPRVPWHDISAAYPTGSPEQLPGGLSIAINGTTNIYDDKSLDIEDNAFAIAALYRDDLRRRGYAV